MSLIATQSSKRHKAIDAVRQKTPERYLPKLLSKEEHVLPEGHPLSVLFDETRMRKMASPLKDSVLRTSLGAIAGGCDIQASSIDRERIASLLDSLKSVTLA